MFVPVILAEARIQSVKAPFKTLGSSFFRIVEFK
jgi:hypothetical protein